MITARRFLSMLCVLSVSGLAILMCMYLAAEEGLVSTEKPDEMYWKEICIDLSEI